MIRYIAQIRQEIRLLGGVLPVAEVERIRACVALVVRDLVLGTGSFRIYGFCLTLGAVSLATRQSVSRCQAAQGILIQIDRLKIRQQKMSVVQLRSKQFFFNLTDPKL